MNYVLGTLSALGIVGIAGSIWLLICNSRTYYQRQHILEVISDKAKTSIILGDDDWNRYYRLFDKVEYNTHLFHLATLRDPSKLYNEEIRI